jgi:hypothetical protein
MSHYEVKNRKHGQISILNDEEIAKLKSLKLIDKFTVNEIKPMRQVISPLAPEVIEVKKKNPKEK